MLLYNIINIPYFVSSQLYNTSLDNIANMFKA